MEKSQLIETVKSAQNGAQNVKSEAFEKLYSAFLRKVYFLALKLLKNKEDAEDLTQEIFLYVFQKIGELRAPEAFPVWLNEIASGKCVDFLRKKRLPLDADDGEIAETFEETDFAVIPEKAFDSAETSQIVAGVIDDLPLAQRICIYLYYYERLSVKEIAEKMGTKETTVKNRLALARAKIRKALEALEDKEGLKLYNAAPLIIIPLLELTARSVEIPASLIGAASVISASLAGTASVVATSSVGTASTVTASATGTASATTASVAGTAVSVKAVAGVAAGLIAVAGITAGVVLLSAEPADREVYTDEPQIVEPPAQVEIDLSGVDIDDAELVRLIESEEIPKNVTLLRLRVESPKTDARITNATPLTALDDLRILELWDNNITDVSPFVNMPNLSSLNLAGNPISDITPLGEMENLTGLFLGKFSLVYSGPVGDAPKPIEGAAIDITPIANLKNLRHLTVNGSQITDATPLGELTRLTDLNLGINRISDVTPLSNLKNLTRLDLRYNQITDISPLIGLTNLKSLFIKGNPIPEEQIAMLQEALPDCKIVY